MNECSALREALIEIQRGLSVAKLGLARDGVQHAKIVRMEEIVAEALSTPLQPPASIILEDAIAFIEGLATVPLLMGDDIEMRLEDVQTHAKVEAASLRKRAAAIPSPGAKGGEVVQEVRLDSEKAEEWPAAQKALWRVVTGENLNDGHYINAYRLTEKLYAAITALATPSPQPPPRDVLDQDKINALPLPLIARFAGDKDWLPIHDIGVDAPLCRIDVSGKLEPRRFSEIMELKDGDGVLHNPDDFYLEEAASSPQPAEAVREACDHSTCTMGVGCETYGVCYADAAGKPDRCAALASYPAPAGEAVEPVAKRKPFAWVYRLAERYDWEFTFDSELAAVLPQHGREVVALYTHPDPEAARLREELERVTRENATLREERHLADNALVDRYRDPKTGSFQFPTDVATIVRRLDATERERDDAVKALETALEDLGLFRDFVINNATVWVAGSGHHHPMWARIAAHLEGYESPRAGEKWPLVRPADTVAARSASKEGASDE